MDLSNIVRHYISNHRPRSQAELAWFRSQPSLSAAVRCAASATTRDGKRHAHQWRIARAAIAAATDALCANVPRVRAAADFDDLHQLVGQLVRRIGGIGELYVYDTALRIGAKLDRLPQRVYLHAGTRDGARALGLDWRLKTLEVSQLHAALQRLAAHEVEDVLCIYKAYFQNGGLPNVECRRHSPCVGDRVRGGEFGCRRGGGRLA